MHEKALESIQALEALSADLNRQLASKGTKLRETEASLADAGSRNKEVSAALVAMDAAHKDAADRLQKEQVSGGDGHGGGLV